MSIGYQTLQEEQFRQAILSLLLPRMTAILSDRAAGHCMRLSDIDEGLMVVLAETLREQVADAQVYILNGDNGIMNAQEKELYISGGKLVELRNPARDGSLRPPLLLFVPANLQATREDSFGVATFEEILVSDIYAELVIYLLKRIPVSLQGLTRELLAELKRQQWLWADDRNQARFLLTALENGIDGESLGAALYEVGLVPDFQLFADPKNTSGRLQRNLDAVNTITFAELSLHGRILQLGLQNTLQRKRLAQLLLEVGVESPKAWTQRVVSDRSLWDLSFDNWAFIKVDTPNKITIHTVETNAPILDETDDNPRLQGLGGQPVLSPKTRKTLKVSFHVEPHPLDIQGLHHFSVQIVAVDGNPIGNSKSVNVGKGKSLKRTTTLSKLNTVDFEDGWHFIRVLAWTEDNDPIPLKIVDRDGTDEPSNESEPFFVVVSDEEFVEEEPTQRGVPRESTLNHAKFRFQFAALQTDRAIDSVQVGHLGWVESTKRRVGDPKMLARFPRFGSVHIPVTMPLQQLERYMLNACSRPASWRLEINGGQAVMPPTEVPLEWSDTSASRSFKAARQEYFNKVQGESNDLVSQAVDFTKLTRECETYAQTYLDLLNDLRRRVEQSGGIEQREAVAELRACLAIDTVHALVTDYAGGLREAVIIGPLHPVRALWSATWAQTGKQWLSQLPGATKDNIAPTRDGLLETLKPVNQPGFVTLLDGRTFTFIDHIHPVWGLYAAATETNARGLLSEVSSALGVSGVTTSSKAISGNLIASRISRYLLQHPYVQTLSINVFNPGDSALLVDTLMQLQKQSAFVDLRYDIRVFLQHTETQVVTDGIEQLIANDVGTNSAEADAFSNPVGNHLFPKLSFAIHAIDEFRANPIQYRAHLTLLFDLFPAEEVGAISQSNHSGISPVHGLIQEFITEFADDEEGTMWHRQPTFGHVTPLDQSDNLVDLMVALPSTYSNAVAIAATSTYGQNLHPSLTVSLNADQRELIHDVHEVSDWVFTIDRNIGVEFYDHGRSQERPDYIIDYSVGTNPDIGYRFIVTSRSLAELEAMLQPVLQRYGLWARGKHVSEITKQLRALSSRLSLKLLSSQNQQAEALGLALARLFLTHHAVLRNQIIVPLDDHLELFNSSKRYAQEMRAESASMQRTDLALFDLDAGMRVITCNLIEVKCYTSVGDLTAFANLKEHIASQINRSESVLNEHFNPKVDYPDRPDRLLKTLELRTLLSFYLERAVRYEVMGIDVAKEARQLLLSLEQGYDLRFTRSAIIFDFDKPGTELPDYEYGIEYHRVGVDLIQRLVANVKPETSKDLHDDTELTEIPQLKTAVFIVPKRDRTVSWESTQPSLNSIDESISDVDVPSVAQETVDSAENSTEPIEQQVVEVPSDQMDESMPIESLVDSTPLYDIALGVRQPTTPQYGLIGEYAGRKIALDLNETHTISLFGVQGSGKSYTLGSIIEMATLSIPNINKLPSPLATVVFHYSQSQAYRPEFTSMRHSNNIPEQIDALLEQYNARPSALEDIVLLVPRSKLESRQAEYPNFTIEPIEFAASELHTKHWKFLMGAVGSQSMYLRQINLILKKIPNDQLTLDILRSEVEKSYLSDYLKSLAKLRLQFAEEYVQGSRRLADVIRPGRLVIVDLRDETIEKDEALGLFGVMLQLFSEVQYPDTKFNKLVVFDEAHKYMESGDLIAGLVEEVREMRHKGTSVLVASQDPKSVPVSLIELSSQIVLHRFHSPSWLKHIQKANVALESLSAEHLGQLGVGEAYIWSSKATEEAFRRAAIKVRCRPRVTQHGGGTKTAT